MKTRLILATALTLASSLTALADVKINDTLSVGGYAAGSYRLTDPDPGTSSDKFDLDAAKVLFTGSFKPVTGVVSLYYAPNAPKEITVLDAFATVDIGGGASVTAGKFLSYMGYEAFDIPNMSQISYANGDFLAPIPGYHSGVRLDYGDEANAAGIALVDSVYSGPNYLKGDGELKHNAGFEAFYSYKGVKDLTLWFGLAYDTKGNVIHKNNATTMFDFWLSYNVTKDSTIGAEYAVKDGRSPRVPRRGNRRQGLQLARLLQLRLRRQVVDRLPRERRGDLRRRPGLHEVHDQPDLQDQRQLLRAR